MTKKEKELALIIREVGAYTHHGDFNMGYSYEFQPDQLVRFAALLEAKVRKECAELCRAEANGRSPLAFDALHECADLIMEGYEK